MKLKPLTRTEDHSHVKPMFCEQLKKDQNKEVQAARLFYLLQVACLALDEAAVAENTCLILGTTMDRTSYSCTLKLHGKNNTVYGATADDLMTAMMQLLEG